MSLHSIYDEKTLLLRVAEGDEKAFSQLFKAYYNHLGDFIIRLTESQELTQEIVQDTFLKIWINRASLSQVNSFKAYLFVVARNHAFNCLKQVAREKSRQKEWENSVLHQAIYNPNELIAADTVHLIAQAIELLPPQQKNVYLLSREQGISHEGIARKLNISHETVKKHMVLALRFLRNHIRTNTNFLFCIAGIFFRL